MSETGSGRNRPTPPVCLLGFGERQSVWPLLKHSENPSLRSFIIDRLARLGADYRTLVDRLEQEADPSIRQALILALGEFDAGKLSEPGAANVGREVVGPLPGRSRPWCPLGGRMDAEAIPSG